MKRPDSFTWDGAAESWQRMGAANERATRLWLQSLDLEQAITLFEQLCAGIPELSDRKAPPDPPPPVLSLIWREA